MTIPKQPRTKAPSAATPEPAEAYTEQADASAPEPDDLQKAAAAAAEAVSAAYLDAHKEQLAAYLSYLERVLRLEREAADPSADFVNEFSRAQGDPQAALDAHRKYLQSNIDRLVSSQKEFIDAAATYLRSLQDSHQKLDEQVRKYNQAAADTLREAVIRTEVRPDNAQSLALLYHGLRTMDASRPGTGYVSA
ncbi:MAG: hypothetical protein WDN24_01685 [Sphingomonas sp.]